jgi:hypothetical protein
MQKAMGYLSLAYIDYLASRCLLLEGHLQAALPLASTAVEKQIKSALISSGENVGKSQHLCKPLTYIFNKKNPGVIKQNDDAFLEFLMRGYDLRYAQTNKNSYSLVINQYRTLISLDNLMLRLDSHFKIKSNGEAILTPIKNGIEEKNQKLILENASIDSTIIESILKKSNKIIELAIGEKFLELVVEYETLGVSMQGDFLKSPNFKSGRMEFSLTGG